MTFSVAGRAMCPALPVRPAGQFGGFWKSLYLSCTMHCSPSGLVHLVTLAVEPPSAVKRTGMGEVAVPVELLPGQDCLCLDATGHWTKHSLTLAHWALCLVLWPAATRSHTQPRLAQE